MDCCCTDADPALQIVPAPSTAPWLRRIGTLIQWALPLSGLALIPKCPACVAGYVLFLTGIGLSLPAASGMRWIAIILCIAAFACLVFQAARRILKPTA